MEMRAGQAAQFEQQEGVPVQLRRQAVVDAGDVLAGVVVVRAGAGGEGEVLAAAG